MSCVKVESLARFFWGPLILKGYVYNLSLNFKTICFISCKGSHVPVDINFCILYVHIFQRCCSLSHLFVIILSKFRLSYVTVSRPCCLLKFYANFNEWQRPFLWPLNHRIYLSFLIFSDEGKPGMFNAILSKLSSWL